MEKQPAMREVSKQSHHERQELCTTRPRYRQGRKLTSVKVYCVNDESRYLLMHGVPVVAGCEDVKDLCLRYGGIESINVVKDYPNESFCNVYLVKFVTLQSARYAKRKMDDKDFFGGILHVCYAPELETLEDTRNKLLTRQREISSRLNQTKFTSRNIQGRYAHTEPTEQTISPEENRSSDQPSSSVQNSRSPFSRDQHKVNVTTTMSTNSTAISVAPPRATPAKRIVYHKINPDAKKARKS